MVDRQDIDALLVSALYGELTPVEEARLTAHLESHPADRTVLADLTDTRQAVRESRILAVQLDPPQAISALLMQEAARRAPRRVVASDDKVSWFQRFTRGFMAHPAMAAAAMLVVVVGVASFVQMRKGDTFVETPRPTATAPAPAAAPRDDGAPADRERTLSFESDQKNLETAQVVVAGDAGVAAGPAHRGAEVNGKDDNYRVDLAKPGDTVADGKVNATGAKDIDALKKTQPAETEQAKLARAERDHAESKAPKGLNGIIVSGDQPQPMELDKEVATDPTRETTDRNLAEGRAGGLGPSTNAPGAGTAAAGGGAQSGAASPPVVAHAPARSPAFRPEPAPPQAAPVAPHTADNRRVQDKTTSPTSADEKQDKDRANENVLAMARTLHGRVVESVKQNNCGGAAQLAVQIYRSAPDYYRDNVASDRSLKSCMVYINSEHDKEVERVRAARARALQTNDAATTAPPAQAPKTDKH